MNTKLTQKIINMFTQFGVAYQLPAPDPEYVLTVQECLSAQKWHLSELAEVLNILLKDEKYTETARFGKYPMVYDFIRIRNQIKSKPFYNLFSAYLSGSFWLKEEVLRIASPAQLNAIAQSGGLSRLYERATGAMPTPVYKLVEMIAENESEVPTELIDTEHRIGAQTTLKQIGEIQ